MKSLRVKSLLWCASLFCCAAGAQEIDLVGNVGWEKVGSRIRIHADQVTNTLSNTASGFLRLQIWATTNVYDGVSDIAGFVIGTANLRSLPPDRALNNIKRVVRYKRPAPGFYYTTITLEENTTEGYVIVDSENFDGVVNLGGFGEGSANLDSNGQTNLTFFGDVTWSAGDGRVQFFAEQIRNERVTGRSGALRVRLFATSTPYAGGDVLSGYPMATRAVGRLNASSQLEFFPRPSLFRPPPPGEYYVTMTLEEYNRGWNIRDYVTFDDTSLF